MFKRPPFLAQFQHALGDKSGLLGAVAARDQHGFDARRAGGGQLLGELMDVGGDGGVGQAEDFRRAAVIGFDAIDGGLGIAFGKFEDVLEMRAAPGINALGIIAHDHEVVVARGQQVDQRALDFVGVLVFIDQDELEAALLFLANVWVVPATA